jgi:hypothetical protein
MSAMMTTAMLGMKEAIKTIKQKNPSVANILEDISTALPSV